MKIKWFIIPGIILFIIGVSLTSFALIKDDFKLIKHTEDDIVYEEIINDSTNIKEIEIKVKTDEVLLVSEDRNDICVINKTLNNNTYNVKLHDDTLSIVQECDLFFDKLFTLDFQAISVYSNKPLVIKVPNNKSLHYDIELSSGKITVSDVIADSLDINVHSGLAIIKDIKSEELDVNLATGEVEIVNTTIEKLESNVKTGKITFSNTIAKKVEAEVTTGSLSFHGKIIEKGEFKVKSGHIVLKFKDGKENYTINGSGNGPCIIKASKTAGDIKYSFNVD